MRNGHYQTPELVLERALHLLRQGRRIRDDYERECRYYARKGYIPRTCIHGTNQWVEWDNICWGCEEGIHPDDPRHCLDQAWQEYNEFQRRLDVIPRVRAAFLDTTGEQAPPEVLRAISTWATDAFPGGSTDWFKEFHTHKHRLAGV